MLCAPVSVRGMVGGWVNRRIKVERENNGVGVVGWNHYQANACTGGFD